MAKEIGYVEKVDAMDLEVREFIRSELAWLSDWTSEKSQLKNYREINRFLHETLDVSV